MKKTPWRKNLDKRYISGEDLLNGESMDKGLRPEMVVTLVRWQDSPAFDQKKQEVVDKTALWLKEYPSGKMLYKPVILNVINGEFLSKEIGDGSDFLEDFDVNKPFVLYACPDRRFGHVARFKKYNAPNTVSDKSALEKLSKCETLEDLQATWSGLTKPEQMLPTVTAKKDELKSKFTNTK